MTEIITQYKYTCSCDHVEENYKFCPTCGKESEEIETFNVDQIMKDYRTSIDRYENSIRLHINEIISHRDKYYRYHEIDKINMKCECPSYITECNCKRTNRDSGLIKFDDRVDPENLQFLVHKHRWWT